MDQVPSGDNGDDSARVAERLEPIPVGERGLEVIGKANAAVQQARASLMLVVQAIAAALDVPEGWQFQGGAFHPPAERKDIPVVDFNDMAREAVRKAADDLEAEGRAPEENGCSSAPS